MIWLETKTTGTQHDLSSIGLGKNMMIWEIWNMVPYGAQKWGVHSCTSNYGKFTAGKWWYEATWIALLVDYTFPPNPVENHERNIVSLRWFSRRFLFHAMIAGMGDMATKQVGSRNGPPPRCPFSAYSLSGYSGEPRSNGFLFVSFRITY
jgi:hypothetical protein